MVSKIAFIGIAGSGKDYLADWLIHQYGFKRISFADQVKKYCKELFPWMKFDYPAFEKETPLNIEISNKQFINKTPRDIWLEVGETMRSIDKYVWFNKALEEIRDNFHRNIIISDIRTKEECIECIKLGFKVIKITRSKEVYKPNPFDSFARDFKDYDYEFINDKHGIEKFDKFLRNLSI